MKSIQDRVLAALAKQAAERKKAEYKAGEHERRSIAARFAAQARKDRMIADIAAGRLVPSTRAEQRIADQIDGYDDALCAILDAIDDSLNY